MSGRKQVTIDSYDLAELRRRAASATSLQASNEAMAALNQRLSSSLNSANTRINTLTNNLSTMNARLTAAQSEASGQVAALRQQLQTAVANSNARLQQQARENREQLEAMGRNFNTVLEETRRDLTASVEENNRRIQAAMDRNNQIIAGQIDQVNSRVDQVDRRVNEIAEVINTASGNLQMLQEMAAEFVSLAAALNQDSQRYRCNLLLPGQFAAVQAQLALAQQELELPREAAPAAHLAAQQAYQAALRFHEEIIRAEQEWLLHHQAAQQSIAHAQAQITACRTVNHEATNIAIDVDQWSGGDLSDLAGEATSLASHLQASETDTLQDLDNIRAAGEHLSCEAIDTAAFALGAAESSQWRANIAQLLANSLRNSNNMHIVAHGYQGDDMRAAHRVLLRCPNTGFEMAITQTPTAKTPGHLQNDLDLEITNPGTNNQEIAHQISDDVCRTLRAAGFNVASLNVLCEDIHGGRKETARIQQWRQQQASVMRRTQNRGTAAATPAAK